MMAQLKKTILDAEQETQKWQERALKAEMTLPGQTKAATCETPLTSQIAPKRKRTPEAQSNTAKKPKGNQAQRGEVKNTPPANEWKMVKKQTKEKPKPRAVRKRADALVIEAPSGSTYADILRKVKNDRNLKDLGEKVAKIFARKKEK